MIPDEIRKVQEGMKKNQKEVMKKHHLCAQR